MNKIEKNRFMTDVSRGALGSVGLSIYILADTFFVAKKLGILGVTVMNLTMPLFTIIEGLGLLLGMGGATLFIIDKIQNPKNAKKVFSQIFKLGIIFGIFFMLLGIFCPRAIASLLGAKGSVLEMTTQYTRIILIGGPTFILNNFLISFVRNDRDTLLVMIAMLASSIWTAFADWFFILYLNLGMYGAGIATVSAPVVSMLIMSIHWMNGKNTLKFKGSWPTWHNVRDTFSLGLPSFLMEMSNGVTIFIFNWVILFISNEYTVAAYGIVTNVLLVALALFTGTAQGSQPFVSREFARRKFAKAFHGLKIAVRTALTIAGVIYVFAVIFRYPIIDVFNEHHDPYVASLAAVGMIVFLVSLFFSAINNQIIIFLASADETKQSLALVILRGYVLIWLVLPLMAWKFQMLGVWLSLPIIEFLSLLIGLVLVYYLRCALKDKYGDQILDKSNK